MQYDCRKVEHDKRYKTQVILAHTALRKERGKIPGNKARRRDHLGIIAKILQITKKGSRKTHIMYRANLSFTQLNAYLPYLLNKMLITRISSGEIEIYVITKKGVDFLKGHSELTKLLKTGSPIQESAIQTHSF